MTLVTVASAGGGDAGTPPPPKFSGKKRKRNKSGKIRKIKGKLEKNMEKQGKLKEKPKCSPQKLVKISKTPPIFSNIA